MLKLDSAGAAVRALCQGRCQGSWLQMQPPALAGSVHALRHDPSPPQLCVPRAWPWCLHTHCTHAVWGFPGRRVIELLPFHRCLPWYKERKKWMLHLHISSEIWSSWAAGVSESPPPGCSCVCLQLCSLSLSLGSGRACFVFLRRRPHCMGAATALHMVAELVRCANKARDLRGKVAAT